MYEMKTLLPPFDIQLPTCMYKMKNISLSAASVVHKKSQQQNKENKEIASIDDGCDINLNEATSATAKMSITCPLDLEKLAQQIQRILKMSDSRDPEVVAKRQERLLSQLNDLKNQLAKIRSTLGLSTESDNKLEVEMSNLSNERKQGPLSSHDIVVNSNPKLIPYGLLALGHLWKDIYAIEFQIFKHSTICELTAEAKAFEVDVLTLTSPSSSSASLASSIETDDVKHNENKPKLCITLIWKECVHTEMISSLAMFMPIYGEVNILRYLIRIGPKSYHYDDVENDYNALSCNEIDSLLDMCHILIHKRHNARVCSDIIHKLQLRLNKREYFVGNKFTIADIAIYSSLKRIKEITDKQLSSNLLSWSKRIHQTIKI